jgi:hypothetical protein
MEKSPQHQNESILEKLRNIPGFSKIATFLAGTAFAMGIFKKDEVLSKAKEVVKSFQQLEQTEKTMEREVGVSNPPCDIEIAAEKYQEKLEDEEREARETAKRKSDLLEMGGLRNEEENKEFQEILDEEWEEIKERDELEKYREK